MSRFYYCVIGLIFATSSDTASAADNIYLRVDLGIAQSSKITSEQRFYRDSGNNHPWNDDITIEKPSKIKTHSLMVGLRYYFPIKNN
jgi:hypothetical protein